MVKYDIDHFYASLVEAGLVIPTGVQGGYGRGPVFEDVLRSFDALVQRTAAPDGAQELMFPPIIARSLIETVGYMDNFPQLAGSVHSFAGSDAKARELSARVHAGERWEDLLDITDERWRQAWDLKVFGFINLTRELYKAMRERKSGVIVNIIGVAGERHRANYITGVELPINGGQLFYP